MSITTILSAIAPKLFGIVDQVVKDKDQADQLKAQLSAQMMDNQSEMVKAGTSVVTAEIQGESWLQRNWRPMLMVWFAVLLGVYWFGFVPVNMPVAHIDQMFQLVQIGVGGYVVGRSGEKIAKAVGPAMASR